MLTCDPLPMDQMMLCRLLWPTSTSSMADFAGAGSCTARLIAFCSCAMTVAISSELGMTTLMSVKRDSRVLQAESVLAFHRTDQAHEAHNDKLPS